MHLSTILLTTLAALTSAAPIENSTALEPRGDSAIIQFFADQNCQKPRGEFDLKPTKFHTGVPWTVTGSHSAFFQTTTNLVSWSIQAGQSRSPKARVTQPAIGRCVGYSDDVYVVGDVSLVVHR